MPFDSIPSRLLEKAARLGDQPAYFHKVEGAWQSVTWSRYAEQVRTVARGLIHLGLQDGHATCILGFNSPEWVIFDVATMMAGGAPAGIYTTCSSPEVGYIVGHSEARIALVENVEQWAKIRAERERLPRLERVVTMAGCPKIDDELVLSWSELLSLAEKVPNSVLDERLDALREDQVATFIYTSGTTGPPKAVMLTHGNLAWTAKVAVRITDIAASDSSVSYLPLSHIAEQMFTIHVPATVGCQVHYAESLDKLPDDLREVQPTVLFGVPRIWEKMHATVSSRLEEATGLRRRIAEWCLEVGREHTAARNSGVSPSPPLKLKHRIARRLLFDRVKPLMGLGNARICVTGAAPIAAEVLEFFAGLDLPILEVYGQSEDTGPTSFNVPGATRYGTVGRKIPDTEVRIAEDGEILVRGPHVFEGYYKDPEATAEALDADGWLHSGDLGTFDADGFLSITGRKKEIIITAGGKNITPKNIEAAIRNLPLVSQAVVIGDRRRFLSALITLDPETTAAFAADRGLSDGELHASEGVRQEIQRGIDEVVNPQFARVEQVRRFAVLPRDFSVDDGELTPTLKIKRRVVNDHFAAEIEAMYAE